ncbi:unnamed protein product, partial [Discosporangium mesarthrocarpum]
GRDGGKPSLSAESGAGAGAGGGSARRPRFIMYFWKGSRANKSDWVLWKLELSKGMVPEWERVLGLKIPQLRVFQGQEPRHLRQVFATGRGHGRLVVHDRVWRKRDNPERRVSLFKVQSMPHGQFQTFQVPPVTSSLSSLEVFVCICTVVTDDWLGSQDEAVWFWVGRHAKMTLQEHGVEVLMSLMKYYCMPPDFGVQILEEDLLLSAHADAWEDLAETLGGEAAWATWADSLGQVEGFDPDEDLGAAPELYLADASSGDVVISAVGAVQQGDLTSKAVAILDAPEAVYLWRGPDADAAQLRVVRAACEAFCAGKPLALGRRVVEVRRGQEPLAFRAHFQS